MHHSTEDVIQLDQRLHLNLWLKGSLLLTVTPLYGFGKLYESLVKATFDYQPKKLRIRVLLPELAKGINTMYPVLLVCVSGSKSVLPMTA